jgi:glycopeptide antibiotics resistance protein
VADAGRSLGLPEGLLEQGRVEFVPNALAFVPIVALCSLFLPALNWRDWTTLGFFGSFAIEGAQVLMTARSATYVDVVANTLGAALGAFLAAGVRHHHERRRERERGMPPVGSGGTNGV